MLRPVPNAPLLLPDASRRLALPGASLLQRARARARLGRTYLAADGASCPRRCSCAPNTPRASARAPLCPPSTWRTRLPLAVAHAGTRGRAAAVRTRANSPIRTCSAPGITGRPVMPVRAATNSAAPRRTPLHRQLSFVARRLHHCAILLSSSAGQRESLAFGKVFILGHTLLTKKNSRREFDHFGRSDDEREVARAGGRSTWV